MDGEHTAMLAGSSRPRGEQSEAQRIQKRRMTNRRSQQRARDNKEALIRTLQKEVERLKRQPVSVKSVERELAAPDIHSSSVSTPSPRLQHPIVNLPACRQAFLAVLASACDPYLNAIQSVSRKFGESRGGKPALDLFPPRPINRPLNENKFGRVIGFLPNVSVSSLVLGHNVPSNNEEPLTLVSFQSPQPSDVEIDCDGVWSLVVTTVDLTLADAEDLAGRLAEQLRCYGLGPVFLESDVRAACKNYPQLEVRLP